MPIAKGLLLKGLAGVTVCAGTAGGLYYRNKISNYFFGIDDKLASLGLESKCFFGNVSSGTCALNSNELKKIKFKDIEGESITIEGLDTEKTLTLKIEKTNDSNVFTDGLKFIFKNYEKEITIKKSSSDTTGQIKLAKDGNPEFKINEGAKLEKAWTVTTLAEKVNLKCPATQGTEKKCTIEENKTVKFSENRTEFKDFSSSSATTDKITYTEDQEGYNQGFKFSVSEAVTGTGTNSGVSLQNGDYEIKYKEGSNGIWYLSKKSS